MLPNKRKLSVYSALFTANLIHPVYAGFDQWAINEFFTSSDGALQYIELMTTADDQADLAGRLLSTLDLNGQLQNSLMFANNLTGETANKTLLLATESFAALTGLTPDFVITARFLPINGGSIDFASGIAVVSYTASQLPKNGVQALGIDGVEEGFKPQAPSPQPY